MIQANELRIGNIIYRRQYKGHSYTEESEPDYKDLLQTVDVNVIGAIERGATHYFPIPLTPKILENAGYNKLQVISERNCYFNEDGYGYTATDNDNGFMFVNDDGYILAKGIWKVHVWQNLYFALTGGELEINL